MTKIEVERRQTWIYYIIMKALHFEPKVMRKTERSSQATK